MNDLDSKVKGIESGADDYLGKPVNKHELKSRVKSLLKKKAYLDKLCAKYEMAVQSAITDKLTGLYSRGYFDHFLDLEIKRSYRQKTPVALLMIDIDNFIDYQIIEIFADNILWLDQNVRIWRERKENKKWRCPSCKAQLSAHRENCLECGRVQVWD